MVLCSYFSVHITHYRWNEKLAKFPMVQITPIMFSLGIMEIELRRILVKSILWHPIFYICNTFCAHYMISEVSLNSIILSFNIQTYSKIKLDHWFSHDFVWYWANVSTLFLQRRCMDRFISNHSTSMLMSTVLPVCRYELYIVGT